jgi:hypothetical protein
MTEGRAILPTVAKFYTMTKISTKKTWVRTDGWRGYEQPIHAVCGANDTGSFSDSPCPSHVRKSEISLATKLLRQNHIPYKTTWCKSSNAFCIKQYVLVAPEHKQQALELIEPLVNETRLLYTIKN